MRNLYTHLARILSVLFLAQWVLILLHIDVVKHANVNVH